MVAETQAEERKGQKNYPGVDKPSMKLRKPACGVTVSSFFQKRQTRHQADEYVLGVVWGEALYPPSETQSTNKT